MRSLNVAIVEDEAEARGELERRVRRMDPGADVRCYATTEQFLPHLGDPDLAFLDVSLAGLDGIEAARRLADANPQCVVIFVSGLRDRVFEALDVHPFHYLVKPVEDEELARVYGEAAQRVAKADEGGRRLRIHMRSGDRLVAMADILYVESRSRKVVVHTAESTYEMYGAIGALEEELSEPFFRCHRGYLVNLDHVRAYSRDTVELSNGESVYLSRKRYASFVRSYMWRVQEKHGVV